MITVVGAGSIGSIIARYLSGKHEVALIDKDSERLRGVSGVVQLSGTIEDHAETLDKSSVVVVALPGSIAYGVVEKLVADGRKVVDISFSEQDPMELGSLAEKSGALLVPDAGFAPGLSNILAGRLHSTGTFSSIEIYVGGLPQVREGPLEYSVTWSVEGLIDEYTRPARIVRGGKIVDIDPVDDITCYNLEGLGEFEAFYSDGLRTLLATLDGVDMFEKTLRYPGHMEKIRFMRDLGLFSDQPAGNSIPREITGELIRKSGSDSPDICILVVRGIGRENREYMCIDRADEKQGISSMSRMTGYTAAVIAEAVDSGLIHGKGVIPPEFIGRDDAAFNFIREHLGSSGIIF